MIHDFAYGAFEFDQKPASFLEAEDAKIVGAELYSFSKTFNMAGWRMAFAVGNEKIIQAVNEFQDHVFVGMFGGSAARRRVRRFLEIRSIRNR